LGPGKTFQKRSVSSPAPVTMVWPSGEMAMYQGLALVHLSAQLSAFYGVGGARRGCVARVEGVLGGV
jgi:hypothetical protein